MNITSSWSFAYGTATINQEGMSLAVTELTNESVDKEAAKSRFVETTNFMLTAPYCFEIQRVK